MNLVVTFVNSSSLKILSWSSNCFLIQLINKSTLSFLVAEIGIISAKSCSSFNSFMSLNNFSLFLTKSILFNNRKIGASLSLILSRIN